MIDFRNSLPPISYFGPGAIIIYDRIFEKKRLTASWLKKAPRKYGVKSGEKLKNIDELPKHLKAILKLSEGLSKEDISIVTLGGGSVGDFGGFVASVLKRGVKLYHIPSTWLAAIDSAHGGKTGLNVSKIKNQIGTFYPAEKVYLVKSILTSQPEERAFEALGEVAKISLLNGKSLWKSVRNLKRVNAQFYWKLLPSMIAAKNKIVERDPFEKNGIRHYLNLGHSMGHVWESQLKIPHGIAVLFGLAFALEWGFTRGWMDSSNYYDIRLSGLGSYLPDRFDLKKLIRNTKNVEALLQQDKKMSDNGKLRFIFLKSPGLPVAEKVRVAELIKELKRQSR